MLGIFDYSKEKVRLKRIRYLLGKDVKLASQVESLLKSVSHWSHLIFFCRVDFDFLLGEVTQFWILLFQSVLFLLPLTLIEQVCLEEPFEFHNDHSVIVAFEAFKQDVTVQSD